MGEEKYLDLAAEQEDSAAGKTFINSTSAAGDSSHSDMAQMTTAPFSSGKESFFGREAFNHDAPTDGGVRYSAPAGAEQGGILDWFRRSPAQEESAEEETEPETEPELAQWVEDEYGQVNEENVTWKPGDGPLVDMLHNTTLDGPAQSPVFETHAFAPREGIDGVSSMMMHSYIGLRFTQKDPMDGILRRRHIRVGFGSGNGTPFSPQGKLRDDWNTQADASTQTPITKQQLEGALEALPRKGQEPYNLLTHNCNTFTKEMAEMVGASVPAKLHDTLLGPIGAHTNLANAAAEGEQERTRFFQGGSTLSGQMSQENRKKLMSQFYETAKSAARWDATPFLLYSGLRNNAQQMQDAAKEMEPFFQNFQIRQIKSSEELGDLEHTLREVDQRGTALMQTKTLVSHPRVNMVAMKTMALAKLLGRTYFPKRQLVQNSAAREELLTSLDIQTDVELDSRRDAIARKRAASQRGEDPDQVKLSGVSNENYFADFGGNVLLNRGGAYTRNQIDAEITGDLFLQAAGLTPEELLRQTLPVGDGMEGNLGNQTRVAVIMRLVYEGLQSGDQESMNEYLQRYIKSHEVLNLTQMAATIAASITHQIQKIATASNYDVSNELQMFSKWEVNTARRRNENSLSNDNEAVRDYLRQALTTSSRNPNNEKRQEALTTANNIERFFFEKLRALTDQQAQK